MPTRVLQPTSVLVRDGGGNRGISCNCCSCLNLNFLQTRNGLLKIAQLILGGMCESMLLNYGFAQSLIIGSSYISLLTSTSACLSTVTLLMMCYVLSQKSYSLIRSSLFETFFNVSAAFSYFSSATYLAFSVSTFLYPLYLVTPGFMAYPAMSAAYMMGFALGLLHAVDAYYCYRIYKGYG